MGILQARILEWVAMLSSRGSSQPRSSASQVDSLLSEPPGKPKNTGVGSLSLLQGIFLTQKLNWGLLHCTWILYQLSYQGGPGLKGILSLFGNFKKFGGIGILDVSMGKKRERETRKLGVRWGQIVKHAHSRDRTLYPVVRGSSVYTQPGLYFRKMPQYIKVSSDEEGRKTSSNYQLHSLNPSRLPFSPQQDEKNNCIYLMCMSAKLLQSCLTLCVPKDCNPPGSSVHGILQASILEWVAMPSSRGSS